MDAASSNSGDLVLPLDSLAERAHQIPGLPLPLLDELFIAANAAACDLTHQEFAALLAALGARLNYGLPPAAVSDPAQIAAFYRALHLPEFALAQACALGREAAWARFLTQFRSPLTQAAIAITQSTTLGHELADSLYAELYGLRAVAAERRSPLASYSGRGSLLGWLRTTLAQRHVDHLRRIRREAPLEGVESPAPQPPYATDPAQLRRLTEAVARTLKPLAPEERFLLSAYYLDRQSLLQIGRLLNVHEATISRRLKRLTQVLRKELLRNLQLGGLSRRAAEEALGADPRDIEINLRTLLQTSQLPPFSVQTGPDHQAATPTAMPNRT